MVRWIDGWSGRDACIASDQVDLTKHWLGTRNTNESVGCFRRWQAVLQDYMFADGVSIPTISCLHEAHNLRHAGPKARSLGSTHRKMCAPSAAFWLSGTPQEDQPSTRENLDVCFSWPNVVANLAATTPRRLTLLSAHRCEPSTSDASEVDIRVMVSKQPKTT